MKTFSEIVKKSVALSGTKAQAQWSVGFALELHEIHKIRMAIQDEIARK